MQMSRLRLEMFLKMYWVDFYVNVVGWSGTEDLCKGKIKVQNDF